MSEPAKQRYMSLESSISQIRILTLQSGLVRDPISCSLSVVSLDDDPVYDALSYVWGDATETRIIELDGQHIEVTVNLMQALLHFRSTDECKVLWVDAVCINQSDIEEKSQQVAMMGRIYRQCTLVQIWLGCNSAQCALGSNMRRVDSAMEEPSSKLQNPFDLILQLSNDRHIYDWACFRKSNESKDLVFGRSDDFDKQWNDFVAVTKNKWWTRMWTVQEAILPSAGIVTYDIWNISLQDITNCGALYYEHVWDCCQHATKAMPTPLAIELDECCTVLYNINQDRSTLSQDEYFDIQEQHLSYGIRDCYDPRDKVYGLLALIGDIADVDLWLTPDYSHSEAEVFYDATLAMLYRSSKSLKCLKGSQYGPAAGKWASWVRDFGATMSQDDGDIGQSQLSMYDLFSASPGTDWRPIIYEAFPKTADETCFQVALRVNGTRVAKIDALGKVLPPVDTDGNTQRMRNTYKDWLRMAHSRNDLDEFDQESTMQTWRTFLSGSASTGQDTGEMSDIKRFDASNHMAWYKIFCGWLETGEDYLDFALERTLLLATYGRCYFTTTSAGQGLCYPTAMPGDEVWVLEGSKMPFILREANVPEEAQTALHPTDAYGWDKTGKFGLKADYEATEEINGYYELIGDCYYDGFMDGEAFEDLEMCRRRNLLV